MNRIQDDLDRALERLRATANRSLQNQTDLDTILVGVIALRTEVKRLEDELTLQRGLLDSAMEAVGKPEEVLIPVGPEPVATLDGTPIREEVVGYLDPDPEGQ